MQIWSALIDIHLPHKLPKKSCTWKSPPHLLPKCILIVVAYVVIGIHSHFDTQSPKQKNAIQVTTCNALFKYWGSLRYSKSWCGCQMVMETLEMGVLRIDKTGRHSSLDKAPGSSQWTLHAVMWIMYIFTFAQLQSKICTGPVNRY